MESFAMIPLISFDTVVNVYLTIIFLIPLRSKIPSLALAIVRGNLLTPDRTLLVQELAALTCYHATSDCCFQNLLRSCLHTAKQHPVSARGRLVSPCMLLFDGVAKHLQKPFRPNGTRWRTRMGLLDELQLR
jgi:hypothetical protein